jgi:hypothetical protein
MQKNFMIVMKELKGLDANEHFKSASEDVKNVNKLKSLAQYCVKDEN